MVEPPEKLTLIQKCDNERVIEMMCGKAMCAFANYREANYDEYHLNNQMLVNSAHERKIASLNEYQATVRCIAMMVTDTLPMICHYIICRAENELGVKD